MDLKIVQRGIGVAFLTPMTSSSYVALPHQLQSSNSLLSIRNREDYNRLMYCFAAAWHRKYGIYAVYLSSYISIPHAKTTQD